MKIDTGGTEYTISLEGLISRLQIAADKMSRHNANRLLLLNAAAALRALGTTFLKNVVAAERGRQDEQA